MMHADLIEPLNVAGLVIGVGGGLLMLYFPPSIQRYTEKDEPHLTFVGESKRDKAGIGKWQSHLAKLGPAMLVIAFLFQLLSNLMGE